MHITGLCIISLRMRTLHYACSAGAIRNRPVVKLDPQEQLIAQVSE